MKSIFSHKSLLIVFFFLLSASSFAQKDTSKEKNEKAMPEESIQVNKEYDENGNLIRFDSIRALYYSSINVVDEEVADSLMVKIKKMMKEDNLRKNSFFDNLFSGDSLLKSEFKKDDFFNNFYKENIDGMGGFFKKMDTLKNNFFAD
jgi:hypothetical protein